MAKPKKSVWERNFAESAEIRDRVRNAFASKLRFIRDQRRPLDDEFVRFFNMWNVTKDGSHTYTGRAQLYVPEVRKSVEAQARQLTEIAFPNEDFFTCDPGKNGTVAGALLQKEMRRWQIEQAALRPKYHVFQRQNVMLGTSPAYVWWNKRTEMVMRRAKGKDGKIRPSREMVEIYNGPDFQARPLRRWFALNPFKPDILDDGCVEFFEVSREEILREEKKGTVANAKAILERKGQDVRQLEEFERDIEMAEAIGLEVGQGGYAGEASISKDDEDSNSRHLCALIFARMVLPEACDAGEDPELPIPLMIRIYDQGDVGTVMRNPFWHQRPPYILGKYILPNPDEFYGQGLPKAVQFMQYEMNSKAEQGMDSSTLALNPLAFIDPGLAAQIGDFSVEPGAIWWVNPQGVKLATIPDTTATAYNAMSFLSGKMMEYSDRTPALPPQLQGKSRTATQSEIVDRAFSVDVKSFQLNNEILVLQPLMEMWESLTDQNVEEDQVIRILGSSAADWKKSIWLRDVALGRYTYTWKVASTMQAKAVMARQMIDMFKVAGTLPPEAQQKLNLQWERAFRFLWTEGFNLPYADEIFGQKLVRAQDPMIEHRMVKLGIEIEVLPGDDDLLHKAEHDKEIAIAQKEKRTEDAALLIAHNLKHQEQHQKKLIMAEIMKRRAAAEAQAAQQEQEQGKKPSAQGPGSGNRTQLSPNASVGNMASGVRP